MKTGNARIALAACTAIGVVFMGSNPSAIGDQKSCKLDRTVRVALDYLLHLPKDYEQRDSWPLLLFLHGAGERGNDLELVKKHGPPKLIESGKQFPFIVVSPQCPAGRWWQPQELTALLDEIVEKYRVDRDRVYVTGLSMGGFGTWALAAYSPDRFAALAPICGGGEAYWTREIAHVPVWAFHGAKDPVVPVERSEKMIAAMQEHGAAAAKLTVYPDAAHDAWTETYNRPDFYDWLLEQKRRPKPDIPAK
jgi:predicted peptidase